MRKWLAAMLAVVVLMGLASACTPAPKQPPVVKEINIGRPYDVTTLDPANAVDDGSYDILRMTGEGLVREVGGDILPGIAESWQVSPDGLEYTFKLRKSNWSDGKPLTANDFVYSFLRLLSPEGAHKNANSGYIFENGERYFNGECEASEVGVAAVDENTLKIQLEVGSLETLSQLARWPFFSVSKAAW